MSVPVSSIGPDAAALVSDGRRTGGSRRGGPSARGSRVRLNGAIAPWVFLAPGLLIGLVFVYWPFLKTVVTSFTDARPFSAGQFVGLANYADVFSDPLFWVAFRNSFIYAIIVVPFMVVLPLLLALLMERIIPGTAFFRTALYTPVVASMVVVVLIWQWLFNDRGLINSLLQTLHLTGAPVHFLSNPVTLLGCAMVVTIWKGLGYYMVVYLAVLGNVPRELHEAAAMDGAGAARRFFTVTVPAMRTTMTLISVLSSVAAFRVFSEVYLLAGPTAGPGGADSTLVTLIESSGTGLSAQLGYTSAISVILFLLTLGLLIVNLRISRNSGDDA